MERTINHGKLELESAADFPWVLYVLQILNND